MLRGCLEAGVAEASLAEATEGAAALAEAAVTEVTLAEATVGAAALVGSARGGLSPRAALARRTGW